MTAASDGKSIAASIAIADIRADCGTYSVQLSLPPPLVKTGREFVQFIAQWLLERRSRGEEACILPRTHPQHPLPPPPAEYLRPGIPETLRNT
eukprot:gene9358-biopygen3984